MPGVTDPRAIDYYWYNYIIDPIAKKLCKVSPSFITFLSTLLIIPIIFNIVYNGPTASFMYLFLLRYFLDCLDGSIARRCNSSSSAGALFDIASDTIMVGSLNIIAIYYLISKKNQDIISLIMILVLGYYTYFMITASISQYYAHKQRPFTKFEKFVHDNGLITFVGFYGLIIKYCCSKH